MKAILETNIYILVSCVQHKCWKNIDSQDSESLTERISKQHSFVTGRDTILDSVLIASTSRVVHSGTEPKKLYRRNRIVPFNSAWLVFGTVDRNWLFRGFGFFDKNRKKTENTKGSSLLWYLYRVVHSVCLVNTGCKVNTILLIYRTNQMISSTHEGAVYTRQ